MMALRVGVKPQKCKVSDHGIAPMEYFPFNSIILPLLSFLPLALLFFPLTSPVISFRSDPVLGGVHHLWYRLCRPRLLWGQTLAFPPGTFVCLLAVINGLNGFGQLKYHKTRIMIICINSNTEIGVAIVDVAILHLKVGTYMSDGIINQDLCFR